MFSEHFRYPCFTARKLESSLPVLYKLSLVAYGSEVNDLGAHATADLEPHSCVPAQHSKQT